MVSSSLPNAATSGLHTVFSAPGWGSTIAEAAFAWTGIPFERVLVEVDTPSRSRDRLRAANPLGQVPTIVLPAGQVLTQSAAIILYLGDLVPDAGLVPAAW
jgi:GST-like protein